ncbi:putative PEP-binding protein [Streptomyces sp. NPDC050848]|uniref:putative PEP-binding protein n=1 Tax=Streptomyces sp. NPDC050848 TaxID=3155791 RepID=UPI0033E14E82
MGPTRRVVPFTELARSDVGQVRGKRLADPRVDRDVEARAHVLDKHDRAVVRTAGRPVGLCGQRPSDDPAFTVILVDAGLDSISVAPDSFAAVKRHVARAEATLETDA